VLDAVGDEALHEDFASAHDGVSCVVEIGIGGESGSFGDRSGIGRGSRTGSGSGSEGTRAPAG
jgi:hypothetical protein